MPGVKISLADILSRHPNSEAKTASAYGSMFTVAKIRSIQSALGFKVNFAKGATHVNHSKGNKINISNRKVGNGKKICNFRKEGE